MLATASIQKRGQVPIAPVQVLKERKERPNLTLKTTLVLEVRIAMQKALHLIDMGGNTICYQQSMFVFRTKPALCSLIETRICYAVSHPRLEKNLDRDLSTLVVFHGSSVTKSC